MMCSFVICVMMPVSFWHHVAIIFFVHCFGMPTAKNRGFCQMAIIRDPA